jgi:hypothetical protein
VNPIDAAFSEYSKAVVKRNEAANAFKAVQDKFKTTTSKTYQAAKQAYLDADREYDAAYKKYMDLWYATENARIRAGRS